MDQSQIMPTSVVYFTLSYIFKSRIFLFLPEASPTGWWKEQASVLFDTLDKLDQIPKILKPLNLMVIAPFTDFMCSLQLQPDFSLELIPKSYEVAV